MHLEIHDQTRLFDIQRVFNDFYPYLQLDFFHGRHGRYEASAAADRIPPNLTMGEVRKTHLSTLLDIQPGNSADQLEKECQVKLGVSVQVLVRKGDSWEQTSGLDRLSLKDLNLLGRNSSDEYIVTNYDETLQEEQTSP